MTAGDLARALLDEDALRAYLAEHLGGSPDAALSWERLGGHSNETFRIRWGGRDLVLRRPPLGPTLPSAHDVLREHRVLQALAATDVPAPRPVLACEDPDVLGKPFYLMEHVEGVVPSTALPPGFDTPALRGDVAEAAVDTLARVHAVDLDAAGLRGLGRGEGYLPRQVTVWTRQMDLTLPRTAGEREVPYLPAASRWLAAHVPETPRITLVHGDYKLDNLILAPEPPARVAAVLDWEMATLGDPLADLGWFLIFWRDAEDPADELGGFLSVFTADAGFPSRAELVARYAAAADLPVTLEDLRFHRVLALFKLATLLEMSFARYLAGTTDDAFFGEMTWAVPALARRAMELAEAAP